MSVNFNYLFDNFRFSFYDVFVCASETGRSTKFLRNRGVDGIHDRQPGCARQL